MYKYTTTLQQIKAWPNVNCVQQKTTFRQFLVGDIINTYYIQAVPVVPRVVALAAV